MKQLRDLLTDEEQSTEDLAGQAGLSAYAAKKRLRALAAEGIAARIEDEWGRVTWRKATEGERLEAERHQELIDSRDELRRQGRERQRKRRSKSRY